MSNILEMQNIQKSFSGVRALKNVNFSVAEGEVHALVGENGAGKSTLIKILTGVYSKDSGQIIFNGSEINPRSPSDAQNIGISPIYQELNLIPDLSVAENIYLGHTPKKNGLIDWRALYANAESLLKSMNINVDVRSKISSLGTAIQQMVAIVRAIQLDCRLIIMDEPTSSLDKSEVNSLMNIIRDLKKQMISVIFISHRLDEIFEICERITVLKDGELVGTYAAEELDQHKLVSLMLGRTYEISGRTRVTGSSLENSKDYLFELKNISHFPKIDDITIQIKRGEILGITGLLGAGRTETAQVLFGYHRPDSGEILKNGEPVKINNTRQAIDLKLGMCPEDRRSEGIIPNMSVRDNMLLAALPMLSKNGFVSEKVKAEIADKYIAKFKIKTPSQKQLIKNLSGGNQQKVILTRWLVTNPELVIFDEPTRGIDIGAKAAIEELIQEISGEGISVLYISSEIEELVNNCDRLLVMRDGHIAGELTGDKISRECVLNVIASNGSWEGKSLE